MNLDFSFIFLDKPRGPATHDVTAYVRKLLGVKNRLWQKIIGALIVFAGLALVGG
jgi:hypothetical protein